VASVATRLTIFLMRLVVVAPLLGVVVKLTAQGHIGFSDGPL
jgi:hypothetical protein